MQIMLLEESALTNVLEEELVTPSPPYIFPEVKKAVKMMACNDLVEKLKTMVADNICFALLSMQK